MKISKVMYFILPILFVVILSGCASKTEDIYNKSAEYWFQKIGENVANGDLEEADDNFVSLKSEHANSPLLQSANMVLAHAHMENEEYRLANYYFDEYEKRYGSFGNIEYVEFMKIKAAFLGITKYYRDQKLIMDTIATSQKYIDTYPNSGYTPLVKNMLIRLKMGQYLLNEHVAALYDRIGKNEAAKIYREKNSASPVDINDIGAINDGFFDNIF